MAEHDLPSKYKALSSSPSITIIITINLRKSRKTERENLKLPRFHNPDKTAVTILAQYNILAQPKFLHKSL